VSGEYHLLPGSSCIDAGDNSGISSSTTVDLAGKPRFWDDPNTVDTGNGTSPIVDMGAYEYQWSSVLLHDWNGDGIRSIIGDVPGFVNCVYFNIVPDGIDPIAVGDSNGDGILSIIGDVPGFVDCVYFGNCPE
jgi:hypothetical protein